MLNEGKLLIGENAPQGVQMDKGMPRHALCLLRPVQTNYGGRTRVCCSFSRRKITSRLIVLYQKPLDLFSST